jgi:hypothetical protein
MIPSIQLKKKEERYDLYGRVLILLLFYINCVGYLDHRDCDNIDDNGTISMREVIIDAIITLTISLFAFAIISIPFFLLGIINF